MPSQLPASADDWDSHWEHYAKSAVQNPAQRMRHDLIAGLLRQRIQDREAKIFDLGSGQGDLLQKLDSLLPGASLLGGEISATGVAISRQKVPRATFVVADVLGAPPALDAYVGWATDAVCCEVLEHLDDPILFLKVARRYLAPGAQLIVTVPAGPMSAFDRHIGHRRHFDRRAIRSMLEEAGYSVDRTYLAGFPFFNLYRLLVIVRGGRIARDVQSNSKGMSGRLASLAMKVFGVLFHANLLDSPFGWQVVATARRGSS